MTDVFFTADTHFSHDAIRRYSNRPFASVEEMDEILIERWNGVVRPGDRVYHLGDFSFGRRAATERIRARLQGRIILLRGNHDRRIDIRLFDGVHDLYTFKRDDVRIVLCHYALRRWSHSHHGAWHLFGHSHGTLDPHGKSFDVGVDCWGYVPLSLDEVIERMRTLPENSDLVGPRPTKG